MRARFVYHISAALLLIVVNFLSPSFAAINSGIQATNMVLPLLYAQNTLRKFVLSAYGKSDQEKIAALQSAEVIIAKFSNQPRLLQRVENLMELEQVKTMYFPHFDSLDDEVQYRTTQSPPPFVVLSPGSTEVEEAIGSLWTRQQKRLEEFANIPQTLSSQINQTTVNQILGRLFAVSASGGIGSSPLADSARLRLANQIETQFKVGIEQIDATGGIVAGSGAFNHADPSMARFFEVTIGEYFKHLMTDEKLNIISSFIDDPDQSGSREKFETMVLSSGPQFQKLFQVYAREKGFSSDVQGIFKRLESNAHRAPFRLIKAKIDAEVVPFSWVRIDSIPIGVGTMAQVHRAVIRLSNGQTKDVAVRVMKPGIAERLNRDNQVLRSIAPIIDSDPILISYRFPKIAPFIDEIISMGRNELNVPATVAAQIKAAQIYNRDVSLPGQAALKIRFHVPEVYLLNSTSDVMVQEFVSSTNFETFQTEQALIDSRSRVPGHLAQKTVEELAKLWLNETMLGSGFYHSDLHQGNIRIGHPRDGVIQVNLLDFGMTGQISNSMQNQCIAFSMVINARKADAMAKALLEFATANERHLSLEQLTVLVQRELDRQDSAGTPYSDFGTWINVAADSGIKFSPELASLNRGITLIFQLLGNQDSKLSLADILRSPILKNPVRWRQITRSFKTLGARDWLKIFWTNLNRTASEVTLTPQQQTTRAKNLDIAEGATADSSSVSRRLTCRDLFALPTALANH